MAQPAQLEGDRERVCDLARDLIEELDLLRAPASLAVPALILAARMLVQQLPDPEQGLNEAARWLD